jgi:hypothetical protein
MRRFAVPLLCVLAVAASLPAAALPGAAHANPSSTSHTASARADIWQKLRTGRGYAVLMRHALAPGTGDPAGFRLGDCSTQRNLSRRKAPGHRHRRAVAS